MREADLSSSRVPFIKSLKAGQRHSHDVVALASIRDSLTYAESQGVAPVTIQVTFGNLSLRGLLQGAEVERKSEREREKEVDVRRLG